MSDVATAFQTAMAAITGSINIVKLLKETNARFVEAEYKNKLAEVYDGLSDAKMSVADLKVVLIEKDQLIRDLKEKLALSAEMTWSDPYFWQWKDAKWEGPFCASCWQDKHKPVRLAKESEYGCRCPVCGRGFTTQYPMKAPPPKT